MSNNDEERRQRSEAARQAAMRERIERQKERDRQIAIDIANVDKKATNRVVFESSDDESDDQEQEEEKVSEKKAKKSKKATLFDSDDDDDGEKEADDQELVIKNRHTGAKGEQLMQMESRFNSDPRFKLDDKFVETDSDDEEEDDQGKESRQEKEKNRELLSKILGKPIREEKKAKNTTSDLLLARPFTRFDPENPEHVEWMRVFEESKQKKTKKVDSVEEEAEEAEEKKAVEENADEEDDEDNFQKSEMFAHLDDKFSSELKEITANGGSRQNGNTGFSFLEMMGRKRKEDDEEEDEKSQSNLNFSLSKPSVSNGVSSNSEKSDVIPLLKSGVRLKRFFIDSNDEQVRSMAGNFRRTQDLQKVINQWTPHRDAIFKTWKKQRKDVMKIEKEKYTYGERKRKRENDVQDSLDVV